MIDALTLAGQLLVQAAAFPDTIVTRTVSADPRFPVLRGAEFNSLIVDSVPSCVDDLRSMIDAYDRLYGDGAGETFFMGPDLDGLPAAVTIRVKDAR